MKMLSLYNVSKEFSVNGSTVKALDRISFDVAKGECLAVVGESGSGKSTIANIILGIHDATDGGVLFKERELPDKRSRELRRTIQLVQQNPLSALNPRRSIGASLRLPLDIHDIGPRSGRKARVAELLEEVGLPAEFARRSPASLSGGQRQRVAIARALACKPELLVLDEPTSALDVLVQARVLKLLQRLRETHSLTYVFITHDLAVARNIADRMAVFEKGELIEIDSTEAIFANATHDYTRRLISAVPVVGADEMALRQRITESIDAKS
ncbi:ABC transporter ATP-binding protein [Martelella mediterranea]|uniref:Peptide/nickel transport system ATP-binding protein n=1 Tax=Martelella mediterranea TaxID=293089 RepID=A0A4R3NS83_9HYPH|nr:ATP-binding cassette domain-containing protein [Martelella mediterranea]TCT39858.1 peptide/nickel transport system ATP-binding protein [Martelella mediterranea]